MSNRETMTRDTAGKNEQETWDSYIAAGWYWVPLSDPIAGRYQEFWTKKRDWLKRNVSRRRWRTFGFGQKSSISPGVMFRDGREAVVFKLTFGRGMEQGEQSCK